MTINPEPDTPLEVDVVYRVNCTCGAPMQKTNEHVGRGYSEWECRYCVKTWRVANLTVNAQQMTPEQY